MLYIQVFVNNIFFLFLGVLLRSYYDDILSFFSYIFDHCLLLKIDIQRKYKNHLSSNIKEMCLEGALICDSDFIHNQELNQHLNAYVLNNEVITKDIFEELFKIFHLECNQDSILMLKYNYDTTCYRLYIHYKNVIDGYVLKLPLNIDEIRENHEKNISKEKLYFLNNECHEIEHAFINDIDILHIIKECNGLFNDFGLLNNHKIKIKYIMKELEIEKLEKFEVKYKNFHLDEVNLELVDHIINLEENEDEEKFIVSNLMKQIILES